MPVNRWITSEAEVHALDRALVVISEGPGAGKLLPDDPGHPRLREYTDTVEGVRLLYWTRALGTIVLVPCIEV
ncbi:hypothetical protein ACF08E_25105 [Streptomyces globisporus]|uniref:hypothetical protein n=1 Tax=Streptomyces globisporus TaxID=1908 RepID=UPI0036F6A3DA